MSGRREEIEERIASLLSGLGLEQRGWLLLEADDIPQGAVGFPAGSAALLIGNHGRAMWEAFSESPEFCDRQPDPMDRWTRRVIEEAVGQLAIPAKALFPFGRDVWPFQRFAKRAMGLKPSPLGLLIHPQYGLWHALRAAIAFAGIDPPELQVHEVIHPCDACVQKPCLNTCPVDAFSVSGFAVRACRDYLDASLSSQSDSSGPDCMKEGCAARNACPVGREWRYGEAQLRFHMDSFRG